MVHCIVVELISVPSSILLSVSRTKKHLSCSCYSLVSKCHYQCSVFEQKVIIVIVIIVGEDFKNKYHQTYP